MILCAKTGKWIFIFKLFSSDQCRVNMCGKTTNSLSLKKNSSNQLFSNFFSKTIAFTKFFQKKCERIALWKSWKFTLTPFWQKIRESNVFTAPQCRNSGNSLSHLFDKKFVKITFLLKKKLLKRRFHEIFFRWERISRFFTLCINKQEKYFVKLIYKALALVKYI